MLSDWLENVGAAPRNRSAENLNLHEQADSEVTLNLFTSPKTQLYRWGFERHGGINASEL